MASPPGCWRWVVRLVVAASMVVICCPTAVDASCAGPTVSLDHSSGPAGDVVEVFGQYFGTACNDVEVGGTFAGPPLGDPQRGIALVAVQGDLVVPLGPVDADRNYEFTVRLTIPSQFRAGTVVIGVEPVATNASATFTITGGGAVVAAPPTTIGAVAASTPADRSSSMWVLWVVGAAVVLLVITFLVARRVSLARP